MSNPIMGSLLQGKELKGPGGANVPAGTRVRASFAYMSCPGGPPPPATVLINDLQPAVDFNLILVGTDAQGVEELIYASEAYFDTEEGFDAIVPHGNYVELDIRYVAPESYSTNLGCGGEKEPYALTYMMWYP